MSQWYLSYAGKQTGPMDQSQAAVQAQANPDGYAWREGVCGLGADCQNCRTVVCSAGHVGHSRAAADERQPVKGR